GWGSARGVGEEGVVAGRLVVLGLLLLLVTLVLVWVVPRFASLRPPEEFEEEREGLAAREVLGVQLRAVLARLRRSGSASGPAEEALPRGSVRYLYRELLSSAARRGIQRQASETPDDYARRLATELGVEPPRSVATPAA